MAAMTATCYVTALEPAMTPWECVTAALTECVDQHVKRLAVLAGASRALDTEAVTLSQGSAPATQAGRELDVIS